MKNFKMNLDEHIKPIMNRMKSIPGIIIDNNGLSSHLGKKLSPGCRACKRNKWLTVFMGKSCNCDCFFCPQTHKKPVLNSQEDSGNMVSTSFTLEFYEHLLLKLKNAAYKRTIEAVGYSGGDPLLYIDRVKYYAKELQDIGTPLYQYMETNAVALTERKAKELREVGISEIRFNLAATNYSPSIIKKMEYTRKIMPFLTVILPALKDTPSKVVELIDRFIDIGVDQITLCEFVITPNNQKYFKDEPYYCISPFNIQDNQQESSVAFAKIFQEKYPIWSRHIIYDVMEIAFSKRWPITINECSALNHYKPSGIY